MLVSILFIYLFVFSLPKFERNNWKIIKLTSYTLVLTLLLDLNIFNFSDEYKINLFNSLFYLNTFLQCITLFILVLSILLILPWTNLYLTRQYNYYPSSSNPVEAEARVYSNNFTTVPIVPEYSLVVVFTLLGINYLVISNSLVSLFLSIELQSFGVYILATLYKDSEKATSAGLKYYLLGGLSTCLILLGSSLIYLDIGILNLADIFLNLSINRIYSLNLSIIGFTLLLTGLIFKIAAAPLHFWAPDVYAGVPTIVIAWLSIIPKISILVVLISFSLSIYFLDLNIYILYILIFALLSILTGSILGLTQIHFKKILTYSTILNIGFILLSISVNNLNSLVYFIFYLIQYSLTSLVILFVLLALTYLINANRLVGTILTKPNKSESRLSEYNQYLNPVYLSVSKGTSKYRYTEINYISELIGLSTTYPVQILTLNLCIFSLAGIPPFVGFYAKIGVLISVLNSGYYFLTLLGVIASIISTYYYLRIVKLTLFDSLDINLFFKNVFNNISNSYNSISNSKILSTQSLTKKHLPIENPNNDLVLLLTNTHSFLISIFTILIVLFWLKPNLILDTLYVVALNFYCF